MCESGRRRTDIDPRILSRILKIISQRDETRKLVKGVVLMIERESLPLVKVLRGR